MSTTAHERRSALLRTGRRLTVAAAALAVAGTAATAATAPPASAGPPQWTIQGTTNPAGANANNVLLAVSCPSATACLAVGFGKTRHVGTAMAESWNSTSWTTTPSAAPPGASQSDLRAVSCTSATACTAVGFYRDTSGTQHDLAERWDGSSWTVQSAPDPAGSQIPSLTGVSCTSATSCEAVGSYLSPSIGSYTDLAEVWNGLTWTIQPTRPAFSKMDFELNSVSCSSPSSCMAVGQYVSRFGGGSYQATWAERWDGTSWSGLFPDVEGAAGDLMGVSCTTATSDCTAVGWYRDASGSVFALAERWNGSTWSLQFPASAVTASSMTQLGVSCPATTACMAVGEAYVPTVGSGVTVTVAESWNGSTWTLDNTPNPGGAQESDLNAVSCPSAAVCTAAGSWSGATSSGPLPAAALGERYS